MIVLFVASGPKTDEMDRPILSMADESVPFRRNGRGLKHVTITKHFTILDVGCGGGRTIEKLAALAQEGTVHCVDYAKGSVAALRSKNERLQPGGTLIVIAESYKNGKHDKLQQPVMKLLKSACLCGGTSGIIFDGRVQRRSDV
jgi:hypothetical protein